MISAKSWIECIRSVDSVPRHHRGTYSDPARAEEVRDKVETQDEIAYELVQSDGLYYVIVKD